MEKEKKICPTCGEEFELLHGNRIYCGDECYDRNKKLTQREVNRLIKEFKDGYKANYKLFKILLPDAGKISVQLYKLGKYVFDQNAFYGTKFDPKTKIQWRKVAEYFFCISKEQDQLIFSLYK